VIVSRGHADASNALNNAGTAGMSHSNDVGTYLGAGGAKHGVEVANDVGSPVDALDGQMDTSSIKTNTDYTGNRQTPSKEDETARLPMEAARQCSGEPASCRNHADRSTVHTDVQSVMKSAITPANEMENVRMCRNRKSHLLNPKLSDPSVLVNEERLGQVVSKYMHCGTRQWRHWAPQVERSSLDER